MKTTTKTYQNANSAEKAAAAKTKKTGIEYFAFEIDKKWVILTTEEFDALGSEEQQESEEQVEEPSIHVNGSFEQIDTDPVEVEQVEQQNTELLEEVFGLIESQGEVEQVEEVEKTEEVEQVEETTVEELKKEAMEALQELTDLEKAEEAETVEAVEKKEVEPFGMKPGYTKELVIPYFGVKGKYLKTADPEGNRIGLADSRVHIVKIEGEMVTIKTTPTYAHHRRFA